ncbi:tRNA (N6-isopentenyl adenosine(37)-C2)-methylthiotransferase MiaB [Candidatus Parcubacteria bacterium]|nr:MAG: tRNA (N6-isopentenyl adenosine(37)-C2)-methylthiotransferase MiaB [Candidatus Parcubacteria bacterium]
MPLFFFLKNEEKADNMTFMNKKTYNIFIIGCQMNKSDSERIAFSLESLGYFPEEDIYKASLVVITTCGVRQSAEDRIYGLIPAVRRKNPEVKIILTGCLSAEKLVKERLGDSVDIWMPIVELDNLPSLLGEDSLGGHERDYLNLKARYESDFSAFIPIGNGCDNFCSYCYVPHARGREKYRDHKEIINEAKDLIKKGYKEITLIAQNVNSYKSADIDFPKLLKMTNDLPGDFWLRFSTSHPKDMSDELIKEMGECEKLCHHVHLPAQAGDDEVLKRMNRKYTQGHYLELIDKIRKSLNKQAGEIVSGFWMPPVAISTDIIVGFPGETEKQFRETVKLFETVKYDMAYIAQYSPRPNTAAAKMSDLVSEDEKKRRDEELNDVLGRYNLENNKKYLNRVVEVLVDSKNSRGEMIGKTKTSKTVIISDTTKSRKIGDILEVKIKSVKNFGLYGEINKDE